jgi:hypothetical protein
MRAATFIDTSVLLEVLRVPGKSQQPDAIRSELRERVGTGESLLLPTATIIETGNHIAQLTDGNLRREYAAGLVNVLRATTHDDPPWVLNDASWDAALVDAICDGARGCPPLPEMAAQKIGAGDVSILAEAEAYERRVAGVQVHVWTLDGGLAAYA